MLNAGGLIKLHYHDNLEVLDLFTDENNVLYYRGVPLFTNIQLSEREHNHLIAVEDGLFVDGTFLDRFEYHDNELYFDDLIVSREYTDELVTDTVDELWDPNPYLQIGKIDLTYWFKLVFNSDKVKTYSNDSDMTMNVLIENPNNQELRVIIIGDTETVTDSDTIRVILSPDDQFQIRVKKPEPEDPENPEEPPEGWDLLDTDIAISLE